jgi:hypothetical protein
MTLVTVTWATAVTVVSMLPVVIGYCGCCMSVVALVLLPPSKFERLTTIRRQNYKIQMTSNDVRSYKV